MTATQHAPHTSQTWLPGLSAAQLRFAVTWASAGDDGELAATVAEIPRDELGAIVGVLEVVLAAVRAREAEPR